MGIGIGKCVVVSIILYHLFFFALVMSAHMYYLCFETIHSPCVPMRERHECHCMLFLTEDNDFVGTDKKISFDEVQELSAGFGT